MKKILVPIDFSLSSEYAAKFASKIAKKTDSEIHLLHMIELPTGLIDMGAGSNFSIPKSMMYLKKVKEKIFEYKSAHFSKKMVVKHAIRFQNPFDGIQDYSKKIKADLIVMGYKGHSKLEEIFVGSNTEKIVRNSDIPVMVIKKTEKLKMKKIIFASSFKNHKKETFEKFLSFTNNFKGKIHLLKINTPHKFEDTKSSIEKIKAFIKDYNLPKVSINVYNDSSIEKGILNFSSEIDADIIALATNSKSGLSHIFNESITKHLSKKVGRPMLTFKS